MSDDPTLEDWANHTPLVDRDDVTCINCGESIDVSDDDILIEVYETVSTHVEDCTDQDDEIGVEFH